MRPGSRPDLDLPTARVDERDTMFARAERRPGTPAHTDYYTRHPELAAVDDRLRSRPPLLDPRGRYFDPEIFAEADDFFERIESIEINADLTASGSERIAGADDPTVVVKEMTIALGAVAVGCTPLVEQFIYTHKGRFDKDYGRPVEPIGSSTLVFLVEMDHEAMHAAPLAPTIRESARQYYRAARISMTVAAALRGAGYRAKPHYDAHYDLILPPLAVRAGLGELGRNNILVADRYGSRVRIGAVTTDLELTGDRPVDLGVRGFCHICKKCADNCPSRALSSGPPEPVLGVRKWPTDVARCYGIWRVFGTDCGVCMAVCPFSHRDNRFHNLVRRVVRLHPWLARLALLGDDLVYGRKWIPRGPGRRK
jgi:ferredoxin